MTASLPTPDGPEMTTSMAPEAPTIRRLRRGRTTPARGAATLTRGSAGADQMAITGVEDLEPPGVQEEAGQAGRPHACRPGGIDRVARDGVPDGGQVDAQLVRPPGHQVELEERPAREPLGHPTARYPR